MTTTSGINVNQPGIGNTNNSWSIFSFFTTSWSVIKWVFNWFLSEPEEVFPANESGDIMRRYMAQQSWFDKISSNWVKLYFYEKATYIIGLSLISGLVGLILGAPTLLAISSVFLSFIGHTLLVSHESNRRNRAKIFAEESIALNDALKETNAFLQETASKLEQSSQALKEQTEGMKEASAALSAETQGVHERNDVLTAMVDEVKTKESHLGEQQAVVISSFETISRHLNECDKSITQTQATVVEIGQATAEFSATVKDMQRSHDSFTRATDTFCLFVNDQARAARVDVTSPTDSDSDDFLNHLLRQNKEDDAILESLGLKTRASESQDQHLTIGV